MTALTPSSHEPRAAMVQSAARIPRLALVAAILAFLAKGAIAFFTYGTLDVTTWRMDVAVAKSAGVTVLYREGVHYLVHGHPYPAQILSHPPSMINLLRFWDLLERLSGLPLQFWMRFFCALADFGTVLLVWKLSLYNAGPKIDWKALSLLAACPISIMVSGFHGNTDPIMVFFLVTSVYCVERQKLTLAGFFFGLAVCIKIVPILFGLCFVLRIRNVRQVVRFAAISASTFLIAGLPYWAYAWRDALHVFATFNSQPWIATWAFQSLGINPVVHRIAFVFVALGLSVYMNTFSQRVPLFTQIGVIAMLFLAFGPGFSVQYFVWGVPWVASLGARNMAIYYFFPAAFLIRLYTIWCKGLPWYIADDTTSKQGVFGALLAVLSWLAVYWTLRIFIRNILNLKNKARSEINQHVTALAAK